MTQRIISSSAVAGEKLRPLLDEIRAENIEVDFSDEVVAQADNAAREWEDLAGSLTLREADWDQHLASYLAGGEKPASDAATGGPAAADRGGAANGANTGGPAAADRGGTANGATALVDVTKVVAHLPQLTYPAGPAPTHLFAPALPTTDATSIPLITIDPPESTDLDQAVAIFPLHHGRARYLVVYAIASVATFVPPGSALDETAWARGTTMYLPDEATPLYPRTLSSGAGSLLPGQLRPACVWTIALGEDGERLGAHVHRAVVRSRGKFSYADIDAAVAGQDFAGSEKMPAQLPQLLREVGQLRQQREAARGGVSARIPEQEVISEGDTFRLEYRSNTPAEEWNAQISLLTGISAAAIMRQANVGIVRTLPPAQERDLRRLRRVAKVLGVRWDEDVTYPQMVRTLDPKNPAHAAFLLEATGLFRGAGYRAFGVRNTQPLPRSRDDGIIHAAIGAEYAHVTAPLRRLVDRYGEEVCLAHCAGKAVPEWVREALDDLPSAMGAAGERSGRVSREAVRIMQALVMEGRVGQRLRGAAVDERGDHALVMLEDPAVMATGSGELGVAQTFEVVEVDVPKRRVRVRPVGEEITGS